MAKLEGRYLQSGKKKFAGIFKFDLSSCKTVKNICLNHLVDIKYVTKSSLLHIAAFIGKDFKFSSLLFMRSDLDLQPVR